MHQKYYLRILSLFQNCDKILENTGGGVSNCINVKIKVLENVGGAIVSNCIKCKFRTRPLADNHGNVAVESFKLFSFKFD